MVVYAITVPLADVRARPDPTAELVTQALLNTPARCEAVEGAWTLVTLPDYTGWVRSDVLNEPIAKGFCKMSPYCGTPFPLYAVVIEPFTTLYVEAEGGTAVETLHLSTALPLRDNSQRDRVQVALPGECSGWLAREDVAIRKEDDVYPRAPFSLVLAYARRFLDTPYLWGGTSYRGIDCSGLVQLCCRMAGYHLPRDSYQQYQALTEEVSLDQMRAGDLIFFGEQRIIHVALALNAHEYIHAEGVRYNRVTINSFSPLQPHYDQRLREIVHSVKRVV